MTIPTDRREVGRLRLRLPVWFGHDGPGPAAEGESIEMNDCCLRFIMGSTGALEVGQRGRVRFQVEDRGAARVDAAERSVSVLRVRQMNDGRKQVVVRFR